MGYSWLVIMKASVVKTVLVYLMLVRFASLTFANNGIVTGVSLVGGSGPHEGTIQLVGVSDESGELSLVKGSLHLHRRIRIRLNDMDICRTLGYPGINRVFHESPYLADVSEWTGFDLLCRDYSSLIGCPAYIRNHTHRGAVKCQTDTGYLGCFRDDQDARPLATSPCPPGPNSNYSCIDRDNMTTESCLEYCKKLNGCDVTITYAGVRAGIECTCGFNPTELGYRYRNIYSDCGSPCSGDRFYSNCGGTHCLAAFNITSETGEQEATTHAVHSSPYPADAATTVDTTTPTDTTTPADATTPAETDGHLCYRRSDGNAVQNAGIGVGVGAVLLAILAVVNVYVYAQTRKQAAKNGMVREAKLTTTATADTSTPDVKHDVYQPLTTPPTSDCYTGLDVPAQGQGNSYENSITPGGAHSGVSVMAVEMEPVYEEARPTDSSDCFYEPVCTGEDRAVHCARDHAITAV